MTKSSQLTTAQSLGALLKSARDIMGKDKGSMATPTVCRGHVARPSSAAGSSTVPVRGTNRTLIPTIPTGGGTPPELAGEDACATGLAHAETHFDSRHRRIARSAPESAGDNMEKAGSEML